MIRRFSEEVAGARGHGTTLPQLRASRRATRGSPLQRGTCPVAAASSTDVQETHDSMNESVTNTSLIPPETAVAWAIGSTIKSPWNQSTQRMGLKCEASRVIIPHLWRRSVPVGLGSESCKMLHADEILRSAPLDWLLSRESFVRYRTLRDVLNLPETHDEVQAARRRVPSHAAIQTLLSRRNRNGYWGTRKDLHTWWPKKDTTFWLLGVLADFGLRKADRGLAKACEYVISTQHAEGGFGWSPPPTPAECFTGILTEALAKLGYADDPRLARAYDWLLSRQRSDGGFWCKRTAQPGGPRQAEPSCAFASLCVLAALVQHPVHRRSASTERAVAFLLSCWERRDEVKYAGHDSQIGKGWEKLKYPFTDYRVLKYLDAVSRTPFARSDRRALEILDMMVSKRDREGRFTPESIHRAYSDFDVGQKRFPSSWLTSLVYGVVRRWASADRPAGSAGPIAREG